MQGGKSALLVFDDAEVDKAVEWAMVGGDGLEVDESIHGYI